MVRAYDPKLRREVALERLGNTAATPATREHLRAEVVALAKLSHPNVVTVFDLEEDSDGSLWLVRELVPGTTLERWLAGSPRRWRDIVRRFVAVGRGLLAVDQAGSSVAFDPTHVRVDEGSTTKISAAGRAAAPHGGPDTRGTCRALQAALRHRSVAADVPASVHRALEDALSADPADPGDAMKRLLEVLERATTARRIGPALAVGGVCMASLAVLAWQASEPAAAGTPEPGCTPSVARSRLHEAYNEQRRAQMEHAVAECP